MRPQQVAGIDPMLQEAYDQYVYDLKEQRPEATPMTIQEFRQWIMSGAQAGGADALRSPAAYGGIMDTASGRRAYGWGSKLKGALKSVAKPFKKVLAIINKIINKTKINFEFIDLGGGMGISLSLIHI